MAFQKGQSGNPAGRRSGRQAFIDRALTYLEDYTVDDFLALTNDRERFGRLSVYDAMIVKRIGAALSKGGGADMERLLDRIMGKSTITVEKNTEDSFTALVAAACALDVEEKSSRNIR